jgi:dipeptidyl-peptidase-3
VPGLSGQRGASVPLVETQSVDRLRPGRAPSPAAPEPLAIRMPRVGDEPVTLERVAEWSILRLTLPDFDRLSERERALSLHLYNASLAGRDITWDQNHTLALKLRGRLETALAGDLPASLRSGVLEYAMRTWIGGGPWDPRTFEKALPPFDRDAWEQARGTEDVDLAGLMFDPLVARRLVDRSPSAGDPLLASAANYYENVTLADLEGLEERYPRNSRLVKRDGLLIEDVYRVGRPAAPGERPAPAGRMAGTLARVVGHLRLATELAEGPQQAALAHLIEFLETGSPASWEASATSWLQHKGPVDLILGFIEPHKDPRGVRGEWAGLVTIADGSTQRTLDLAASRALALEKRLPWADEYKRTSSKAKAPRAVSVAGAHGGSAPLLPPGLDLPNDDAVRAQHGSRSLLLMNVVNATERAILEAALSEVPAERTVALKWQPVITRLRLALHEVVGHASGRASEGILGHDPARYLKEWTTVIEEARAELVYLHLLHDPVIRELAPECTRECIAEAERAFLRRALMSLRHARGDRLEDDHRRAWWLIVQHAIAKGGVEVSGPAGRRQLTLKDESLWRSGNADLLTRLQRIKSEGLHAEAADLVMARGLYFDKALRDEVTAWTDRARLPDDIAFVVPELHATRSTGGLADVEVVYPPTLAEQMMGWSR